jgi:hypothetical protein
MVAASTDMHTLVNAKLRPCRRYNQLRCFVSSPFYRVLLLIGKLEAGLLLSCTCLSVMGACIATVKHATKQALGFG